MAKKIPYWKTPEFWEESEKQEKFVKKVNRLIDKKHFKDLKALLGKSKKSDWL